MAQPGYETEGSPTFIRVYVVKLWVRNFGIEERLVDNHIVMSNMVLFLDLRLVFTITP